MQHDPYRSIKNTKREFEESLKKAEKEGENL